MTWYVKLMLIYLAVISVVTIIVTVYDKICAKKGKWRIPESTLMLLGLCGGALAEFITMKIIRHKTQHKLFMIGLPLEIVINAAAVGFVIYFSLK